MYKVARLKICDSVAAIVRQTRSNSAGALLSVLAVLVIGGHASTVVAANVESTMTGHITSIDLPLRGLGVEVGDQFGLVFTFDDAHGVHSQTTVNGSEVYDLIQDTFTTGMDGWYGSFPAFLASRYPATAIVGKKSWFRPANTLHHEDWGVGDFELFMVTNYALNPGGESYGWYRYGQNPEMTFLLDSVVTTPVVTTSVPEPETYVLLLTGLAVMGVVMRRRSA